MLPNRQSGIQADKSKYTGGVSKMTEMQASLKRLQDEIAAMQPKLEEQQSEMAKLMTMIQLASAGLCVCVCACVCWEWGSLASYQVRLLILLILTGGDSIAPCCPASCTAPLTHALT